jgi:hypothetical protein
MGKKIVQSVNIGKTMHYGSCTQEKFFVVLDAPIGEYQRIIIVYGQLIARISKRMIILQTIWETKTFQ